MANKWYWTDPEELIKRIDIASQSEPERARVDKGYNDIASQIDRASASHNPLNKTPISELQKEGLLPIGFEGGE